MYTIQQVAKMTHIPATTLRYYDKEGLLRRRCATTIRKGCSPFWNGASRAIGPFPTSI